MRLHSRLALTILLAPGLINAQAPAPAAAASQTPSFSARFKAGKPDVERLVNAFEYRDAFAKAQTLLPEAKPAFDKSSVNAAHASVWNLIEAGQAYFLAFKTADAAGQWEKAMEYIAKAQEIAKDNQAAGVAPLTEQMEYWQKRADAAKALLTTNADAAKELRAKTNLEDYEKDSLKRVESWEKDQAEGEKWAKFFKYDMDMSSRDVEYYDKLAAMETTRIKSQKEEIDGYKPHPGSVKHWVEAVVATPSYLDAIPDKGDKISLLCRLAMLDPENKRVEHVMDILMGKAAPDKKGAPARKGKG